MLNSEVLVFKFHSHFVSLRNLGCAAKKIAGTEYQNSVKRF